jgi:D-glycero-D-manno-heptose 1,7-bisphosphate phosphatase
MKSPALFLDRDGVINVDKTYVYRFADIEWMPGIFDLIKWANDRNYKVIVLTNQSGIGREYYTKNDVLTLHQQMSDHLAAQGLVVTDWYFSESLTDDRRKPSPLMMVEAAKKHDIDLSKSIMVGDKSSDLIELQGPEYILIRGSYPLDEVPKSVKIFDSILEIKNYLQAHYNYFS